MTKGNQDYLNDKKNKTGQLLESHNESLFYYLPTILKCILQAKIFFCQDLYLGSSILHFL